MRNIACFMMLMSTGWLILTQSPANAAAAKATFYACTQQAVFKEAFERPAHSAAEETKGDKDKREAYFKSMVATGECTQLAKGEDVSVDQRDKDLWCVRPSGALNCYWTVDKEIDLSPSMSSTGDKPRGSRRH